MSRFRLCIDGDNFFRRTSNSSQFRNDCCNALYDGYSPKVSQEFHIFLYFFSSPPPSTDYYRTPRTSTTDSQPNSEKTEIMELNEKRDSMNYHKISKD